MQKSLCVMDSSGDTRIEFNAAEVEAEATRQAQELIARHLKQGSAVFAVNRGEGQPDKRVTNFNDLEADNVIVPLIVGG